MSILKSVLKSGSLKLYKVLLDRGADISKVDSKGRTALHFAAINKRVEVIEFVLDQGIDVNCRTNDGKTALHLAAWDGNAKGCELLLKRGAKINIKNTEGHTPLWEAFSSPSWSVVQVLLEHGAYIADQVINGENILEFARNKYAPMRDAVTSYIVKLIYLNWSVNEKDREMVENEKCYREYYQKCISELENMEKVKFYNTVSIFDVLIHSEKGISGYARNHELINALEEGDYESTFLIYFNSRKKKFDAEVQKQKWRNSAAKVLSDLFKFNDPFHLIVQKVLSYLKDDELKFLET